MITISTTPSWSFHPARHFYVLGLDQMDFTEPGVRLRLFPRGNDIFFWRIGLRNTLVCLPHAISILLPGPKASMATTPHIQQRAEHKKILKELKDSAAPVLLQNRLLCNLQCRWGLRTGNLQQKSLKLRAGTKWLQWPQSFTLGDWRSPSLFPMLWPNPCDYSFKLAYDQNEPKLLAFGAFGFCTLCTLCCRIQGTVAAFDTGSLKPKSHSEA